MNLERSLVLNRYLHGLLGAERFDDLQRAINDQEEGPGPDGQSRFFHTLSGRADVKIERSALAEYDLRIMQYEARLANARRAEPFRAFKYFQYLALLYTEIFLDRLTNEPAAFLAELNDFRRGIADFADIPDFAPDDMRRLAFFMATGSGKTLLLHVNILQVFYYLKAGRYPEALVRRPDGRPEFDNVLLITPGEGLSAQHIAELEDSGFDAGRFEHGASSDNLFGPKVQVIEIHKLSEEASAEGVSVPVPELGSRNLVIVDEGHKGTGSEARAWKNRQEALSRDGFLLEYSATFAQSIGAAAPKIRQELLATYGKSIIFDYSYRYFYGDGYGKTFRVLNLQKASASKAHDLMLGGLLIFFQQAMLHKKHEEEARQYNIEKPLWVLLGTSVSRKRADEKDSSKRAEEERTDVAEVVAFLRRFLEEPEWAEERIARTISGSSGFSDHDGGGDLFVPHLGHLKSDNAALLYKRICKELFHGQGGLEVVEMKRSGEIGLRVSASARKDLPYFGIINIGDLPDFKKHLAEKLGIEAKQDVMTDSLFERISRPESPITMLIGAKKFIEGWSSWRVSAMGLLRIGKGEGSQVIQLFGRGVRLKGKDKSLKRSHRDPGAPEWLESLETLSIVGWNADYLAEFRKMLERENLSKELAPLRVVQKELPFWTYVPRTPDGFDASAETWTLDASGPRVSLNLVPQIVSLTPGGGGTMEQAAAAGLSVSVLDSETTYSRLLDHERLYSEMMTYKTLKGYSNVFIPRDAVGSVLASCCELRMPLDEAKNPERLHQAASRGLKTYLDRFVRMRERQAESRNAMPLPIVRERQLTHEYRITVHAEGEGERLLREIERLLQKPVNDLLCDAEEPLPRFSWDRHLFDPLLLEGGKAWQEHVSISPPALVKSERKFVQDLRAFWSARCREDGYCDLEVCLLRNLPKTGVGIFVRSGFYPDFILWLRNKKTNAVRVVFLDPHGLHHEGIQGNDRFEAITTLRALGSERRFQDRNISLDGVILVPKDTKLDSIPGAKGRTWDDLERDYPLLRQEGEYIGRIFRQWLQ